MNVDHLLGGLWLAGAPRRRRQWKAAQRTPNLMIVGGLKCGTSTLHAWLARHPQALMSNPKELHQFDNPLRGLSVARYLRHFAAASDAHRVIGESTPNYICIPDALERIREVAPDMRLVMVVRHPVERAISHYWMEFRNDRETLPMAEAFAAEARRTRWGGLWTWRHAYARRGQYIHDLRRAWRLFGRERCRVLTIEDLDGDSPALTSLLEWLDLDPALRPQRMERQNQGQWSEEPDPTAVEIITSATADATRDLFEETGIDYRSPWRAEAPGRAGDDGSVRLANGHAYRFEPGPATWEEAEARCTELGGRPFLGCDPTVGEMNSARTLMARHGTASAWTGVARIGGIRFADGAGAPMHPRIRAFAKHLPEGHGAALRLKKADGGYLEAVPIGTRLPCVVEFLPGVRPS